MYVPLHGSLGFPLVTVTSTCKSKESKENIHADWFK